MAVIFENSGEACGSGSEFFGVYSSNNKNTRMFACNVLILN